MNWRDFIPPILARKASAVTRALVVWRNGDVVWTKREFEGFAKEGYSQNVTVYACISLISRSVAGLPWSLYKKGRSGKLDEVEEHALLNLLKRPNPFQGQSEFFEAMVGFELIGGNSYIEKVGPNAGPPRELYTLRPDRIKIIPHAIERVAGYKYELNDFTHTFKPKQIVHLKFFAPLDDWYGLSPIEVAARDVDTDNEAKRWNYSLLQNDARPPGALSTDGDLSDIQYERLKLQIKEEISGVENAHKPLLLESGLKWVDFALSPADMDWINGRKMGKREICQVFHVPPELIGDGEVKTYSNYAEARKAFYLETVFTEADKIRDQFNNGLVPDFGDMLYLDYDRDRVDAVQEDRGKVWERVQRADFLTVNEKRVAIGYDEIEGGDVILIPMTVSPLGAQQDDPEPEPEPEAEPEEEEE